MAVIRQVVITDGNRKHSRTRQKRKPVICRLNEILWLTIQMKPLALYHLFLRILQKNKVTFVWPFFLFGRYSTLSGLRVNHWITVSSSPHSLHFTAFLITLRQPCKFCCPQNTGVHIMITQTLTRNPWCPDEKTITVSKSKHAIKGHKRYKQHLRYW